MKRREPLSDKQVISAGHEMWERYEAFRWADIPAGARILMAYAEPRWAWRAKDDEL